MATTFNFQEGFSVISPKPSILRMSHFSHQLLVPKYPCFKKVRGWGCESKQAHFIVNIGNLCKFVFYKNYNYTQYFGWNKHKPVASWRSDVKSYNQHFPEFDSKIIEENLDLDQKFHHTVLPLYLYILYTILNVLFVT